MLKQLENCWINAWINQSSHSFSEYVKSHAAVLLFPDIIVLLACVTSYTVFCIIYVCVLIQESIRHDSSEPIILLTRPPGRQRFTWLVTNPNDPNEWDSHSPEVTSTAKRAAQSTRESEGGDGLRLSEKRHGRSGLCRSASGLGSPGWPGQGREDRGPERGLLSGAASPLPGARADGASASRLLPVGDTRLRCARDLVGLQGPNTVTQPRSLLDSLWFSRTPHYQLPLMVRRASVVIELEPVKIHFKLLSKFFAQLELFY